ncbi:hypothetical protein [Maridesulfovibrio sp. FT414]|uniref:hypothetical protein n=1 Tax=Maridesulfovibrio sp. FT414 TaxID=2979469 RepID=UPI003D8029A3
MHQDLNIFYEALSPAGRRVIAALIRCRPDGPDSHVRKPFPCVISALRHVARCCKLTVLRNLTKAEKAGLLRREISRCGHRYGSIITLHADQCAEFMYFYENDHGPEHVTEPDRYQPEDTATDRYRDRAQAELHRPRQSALPRLDPAHPVDALFMRLSDQGKRVFGIICRKFTRQEGAATNLFIQHTAQQAGCSEVTARRIIRQGHKAGIFEKSIHERGPRFGVLLTPHHASANRLLELLTAFPPAHVTRDDRYQPPVTVYDRYQDRMDTVPVTEPDRHAVTDNRTRPYAPADPAFTGDEAAFATRIRHAEQTATDRYPPGHILDRQIINLSGTQDAAGTEEQRRARRLLNIGADEFQVLWPGLHREGFGPDQIRQIVTHRMSFDETVLDLENSLHAAEYELETGSFPKARKGACNYLFATLRSKGTWRRPPGFLTPNEQALANAEKERQAHRKLKELEQERAKQEQQNREDEYFEKWLAEQTESELARIDAGCALPINTDVARRSWRKRYWRRLG